MTAPRITSRADIDRIENTLLSLVLDQEYNVYEDTEDLCAMAALARAALPPEPGANPLDTPEVREAVMAAMIGAVDAWPEGPSSAEEGERAEREMTGAILDALAPHVAAIQRTAWRAAVKAAAEVCDEMAETNDTAAIRATNAAEIAQFAGAADVARGCGDEVRALPVPAEFAAPDPSMQTLHAEFWRGRVRGREDAQEACQRYAALLRGEARECREAGDDAGKDEALARASAAAGCADFIAQLGPVDEPQDAEEPDSLAGLGVTP